MSWSDVLPWWVYMSEVEDHQALMSGAFPMNYALGVTEASRSRDFTFIPT